MTMMMKVQNRKIYWNMHVDIGCVNRVDLKCILSLSGKRTYYYDLDWMPFSLGHTIRFVIPYNYKYLPGSG